MRTILLLVLLMSGSFIPQKIDTFILTHGTTVIGTEWKDFTTPPEPCEGSFIYMEVTDDYLVNFNMECKADTSYNFSYDTELINGSDVKLPEFSLNGIDILNDYYTIKFDMYGATMYYMNDTIVQVFYFDHIN